MAHPYQEHRQHKVEKSRVRHIVGRAAGGRIGSEEDSSYEGDGEIERDAEHGEGRSKRHSRSPSVRKHGGHVSGHRGKHRMDGKRAGGATYKHGGRAHGDEKEDRALFRKMMKEEKKEHRARGGRTKHKGKTNISINIGHQQPHPQMGMPMLPPPAPKPMMPPPGGPPGMPPGGPPGLGGGPPPGGPPGGPPGLMPPGMPPPGLRKRGGRVKNASNAVKPAPAMNSDHVRDAANPLSGAKSTPGDRMPKNPPGWTESARHKTPVQHTDGKNDGPNIGRPKAITYHQGGSVKGVSHAVHAAKSLSGPPAKVSKMEPAAPGSPAKVSHAEKAVPVGAYPIKSGSKSGEGRLEKARAGVSGRHVA